MPASTRTGRATLALVVAAGVIFIGWKFWPSEARRVRGRLDALAAVVNEQPREAIGQVARAAQLADFFTDDVVLEPGRGAGAIHGRERLLALASRAPNDGDPYRLDFVDVSVALTGEQAATAHLTARLWLRNSETAGTDVDAREVEVQFRRTDDWRIARIALIDTLEKPVP